MRMPILGPQTNGEIFDQRMRELRGDNPEPKPPHPLLRRPQWLFVAILVTAVMLVGLLGAGHSVKSAKVTAEVVLCGGPAPGPCRVESYGSCPPCVTTSSVTISDAGSPAAVYRVPLIHGRRATLELKPGTYMFRLIGTGKQHRRAVLTTKRARIPASGSVTVKLVLSIS
jgi:hypothetical protein